MKLRIKGNLLRLRLTRSEVDVLNGIGKVEESVSFGPAHKNDLTYTLEKVPGNDYSAGFNDGRITIGAPAAIVTEWANGEHVGIEGCQRFDENTELRFIIEKDFVCLTRDNEDQSDNFPNTKGKAVC